MNGGLGEAMATADEHRGGDVREVGAFVEEPNSERQTPLYFHILGCKTNTLHILPAFILVLRVLWVGAGHG